MNNTVLWCRYDALVSPFSAHLDTLMPLIGDDDAFAVEGVSGAAYVDSWRAKWRPKDFPKGLAYKTLKEQWGNNASHMAQGFSMPCR